MLELGASSDALGRRMSGPAPRAASRPLEHAMHHAI